MFGENFFHRDVTQQGAAILYIGCHNDGQIYFRRKVRSSNGEFLDSRNAVPLVVGPHEGRRPLIIANAGKITVLDGERLQYDSTDGGTRWTWQGVGDPPAGHIE